MANLLNLERVSKAYGVRPLLTDVSLGIAAGERIGIVGRNGMGKSTLCKAVMGITPPRARGSIRLDGEEILGRPSYDICRRGVAYVPQGRRIFPSLTTDEHLRMVARSLATRGQWTVDGVAVPDATRHPYTRALFSATPSLLDPIDPIPLTGPVPSAVTPPSGCPFRTRCWRADETCAGSMPAYAPGDLPAHRYRCHHPVTGEADLAAAFNQEIL